MALSDRIPYQAQIDRPKLKLPNGRRLAVWVILNVEEWRIENPMPRTVLSPPMGEPLLPDVPNWSWHEYGMRAGFWRQFKALTDRKIPVTLALNANVCDSYPRVASAAREAGFEFMGHGFFQGPMHKLENQSDAIKRSVETITNFVGKPPRSWESPGLTETEQTLDLLRLNGIQYVADWVIDDAGLDLADAQAHDATSSAGLTQALFQESPDGVLGDLSHVVVDRKAADPRDRADREDASAARRVEVHDLGASVVRVQPLGKQARVRRRAGRELVGLVARRTAGASPMQRVAAEDAALAERYDRARDLLWAAPCDLAAAEAAVAGYQQAVLGVHPR